MTMLYLHFTDGDHLYFNSWHLSSHGVIAGASIALLVLATLDVASWTLFGGLHDYLISSTSLLAQRSRIEHYSPR
jgi:hypothetical protein